MIDLLLFEVNNHGERTTNPAAGLAAAPLKKDDVHLKGYRKTFEKLKMGMH